MINSGKFLFANIDLSKPVHLAAPNNHGKSTLVNSLQFLYVDDIKKMRFGPRTYEDSLRHYFGRDPSYLVYECQTPSGTQCMVVRGLSSLRDGQYERYIYEGEFREDDYVNGRTIKTFDAVKIGLAGRQLARVKNSDLWRALSGDLSSTDSDEVPRLNILPFRRREEYVAFRNVYVRLLSLSNADAKTLRQLIIESHARDIGERKIDITSDYKDEFERAERSEQGLKFIHAAADAIDKGRAIRIDLAALIENLTRLLPIGWQNAVRCQGYVSAEEVALTNKVAQCEQDQREVQSAEKGLLVRKGQIETELRLAETEWSKLNDLHQKWSGYSAEFIAQMRLNAKQKEKKVADLEKFLDQAQRLDVTVLRRQVDETKRRLLVDNKVVDNWKRTLLAELQRASMSESELDAAFRVINPEFLNLIIDDTIQIKNKKQSLSRLRELAQRVKRGTYTDEMLEAKVSDFTGASGSTLLGLDEVRRRIELNEEDLKEEVSRLTVAEDQKKSSDQLALLRKELAAEKNELDDFDRYESEWSTHSEVLAKIDDAKGSLARVVAEIQKLEDRLIAISKIKKELDDQSRALSTLKADLISAMRAIQDSVGQLTLAELAFPSVAVEKDDGSGVPKNLSNFVASVTTRLATLGKDVHRISDMRGSLKTLQARIVAKSREFEKQHCYFSDEDDEWNGLIERLDSLSQMEEAANKNWNALLTPLRARFNGIITAIRNIKRLFKNSCGSILSGTVA